jgi:ABC-2 type transport system permease protein
MGTIFTLAAKDLLLLWRDKAGLFWVIGFPLLIAFFFGSVFGGFGSGSTSGMKIGMINEDQTDFANEYVARLDSLSALNVQQMSLDSAHTLVRQGKLTAYVRIKKGFGESMGFGGGLEVGIDPSRQMEGQYLRGMLMQATFKPMQEMFSNPAKMKEKVVGDLSRFDEDTTMPEGVRRNLKGLFSSMGGMFDSMDSLKSDSGGGISGPKVDMVDVMTERVGPRSSWEITFPQALIWALIGCASAFSVSVVVERTRGTYLRLRLAPITRAHILAGKGLACFTAAVTVSCFILAIGVFILGMQIGSVPALAATVLASAFCFSGMMMTISVLGKTEQAVGGSGMAIMLIFAMVGGGMIPLFVMPSFMKAISDFSPVKWSVLAAEGAIWRGFSFGEMFTPIVVLLCVGLAGFTIGVTIMRRFDD